MQDPIKEAVDKLKLAKVELEAQLESVGNAIKALEGSNRSPTKNDLKIPLITRKYAKDYDKEWSLPNKLLFLLKNENRFLHFREAATIVVELEDKGDIKILAGKISAGCGKLKREGVIIKYQIGSSNVNTFWGSPKWLDNEGNIKEGHEYNEKYLVSGGKKSAPLFEI